MKTSELKQEQLTLKTQWENEQKVTCKICDKEILVEDSCECAYCGKTVCGECSSIERWEVDDWAVICEDCSEKR